MNTGELSPHARNGWRASDPGSINGSAINLEDDARGRAVLGLGLGLPTTSPQAKGVVCHQSPIRSVLLIRY